MIPDFEMMKDRNRIWISYKNCNIIGIDAPQHWKDYDGKLYNGWVLHRWVSQVIPIGVKLDVEKIRTGFGIKIIGVDEI